MKYDIFKMANAVRDAAMDKLVEEAASDLVYMTKPVEENEVRTFEIEMAGGEKWIVSIQKAPAGVR